MFEKRAGAAAAEVLTNWGIDHIYGIPGDSINELVEDLRKHKEEIRFIQVRHEEVAALSAAAYAKLTGKIGVCLSIAGPGAVHLLNGLYDAKADGVPVLVFAGQVESSKVGTDAFQEINLENMFSDVAVFNKQATSHEQLPDLLNQAIRTAYAEKGVAVLTVPDDFFAEKGKWDAPLTSDVYAKSEPALDPEELEAVLPLIKEAEKPLILAGKGALHARKELKLFAEKIGAPVIATLPAKGVLPDEDPYCLGHVGQIGTKPAYEAMKNTDLLIMAGTSFPYREFLPEKAKAFQIDTVPVQIGKRYPVTAGINGDVKEVLEQLLTVIPVKEERKFLKQCQASMDKWRTEIQKDRDAESDRVMPPQIMAEIEKVMEKDAILSVDVGNVTVWTARYLPFTNQRMVISSWMATMGCGLPGAIAAKVAYPDKQVLSICGDGGFSMVMHDFVTAVRNGLSMTIIVLNNEALGLIKYEQGEKGHIDYATELAPMDFAKFAEACGGVGYRVNTREEFRDALEKAVHEKKPVIIDALVEEEPPLPGKITYQQAVKYSEYLIKKAFEEKTLDLPPIQKSIKRIF
ncbi:pyruvate oxidase [Metabacillus sp. GX 13764]|uniref:pyruvate oxidase n=1 Tax=Metabacillus kandeliae TaxID=2900151 RepID=UPI001E4D9E12|nr:pyruvate oxidase [Metabacillus kandeliae]MCD7034876.1 pyruvate oxidase [Metabacillus kandeliae]